MTAREDEYCYLRMTSGPRLGTNFLLDPTRPNRIGRGTDCEITLVDPICSRVHARLVRQEDGWWLQDAESRNGCFVNDERVELTRLLDGVRLKFGATEFVFHQTDEPPTLTAARTPGENQTVIKEARIDPSESNRILLTALQDGEFAHDLLVLYQLSVSLLACHEPDQVIRTSLNLLHERTRASVVGFLWASEDGHLRPKRVLPDRGEDVSLNKALTDVVCEQGRAVWISNHAASATEASLRRYSDAICVPLVKAQATFGVLHLYLKQGRFRQADFEFAISVANLMAVSLVRTRKEASLVADHARLVESLSRVRRTVGRERRHARFEGEDRPRGTGYRLCVDSRREWLGKRTRRPGVAQGQFTRGPAVAVGQLRGHAAGPDRKPTVRTQTRRVYRGRHRSRGVVSASGYRHPVPGRDRRIAAGRPGQAAADPRRLSLSAGGGRR